MPRRSKWNHTIHKYNRVTFKSKRKGGKPTELWRCVLTNCQHYLVGEMVIGKLCVCNRCGDVFEMKEVHLNQKKPHCITCTKPSARAKKPDIAYIAEHLEELLRND